LRIKGYVLTCSRWRQKLETLLSIEQSGLVSWGHQAQSALYRYGRFFYACIGQCFARHAASADGAGHRMVRRSDVR
jgi:hypothetical protein